jgi:hypothetical protein
MSLEFRPQTMPAHKDHGALKLWTALFLIANQTPAPHPHSDIQSSMLLASALPIKADITKVGMPQQRAVSGIKAPGGPGMRHGPAAPNFFEGEG